MGGTDDADNLVELTVEEHALAHKELYERYGKDEDRIAWLSLSQQMTAPEVFLETSRLGGLNNRGKVLTEEHKQNLSKSLTGRTCSEEHKKKVSKAQTGKNNSMYGVVRGEEYSRKQSEAMKAAWARRKAKQKN